MRLRVGSSPAQLHPPELLQARERGKGLAALPAVGEAWPWVDIIVSHGGARAAQVDALVAAGVQGLVVAGTGDGAVHEAIEAACLRAQAQGVAVWRSTRCATGQVGGARLLPAQTGSGLPAVASSPAKARISLQLVLMGVLALPAA